MRAPHPIDHPLYQLLHNEKIKEFNEQRKNHHPVDLSGGDFRGADLRGIEVDGVSFADAYFRGADLRGIDFRRTNLDGASLAHAQISGTYFPKELSAEEVLMSVNHGTRLRYR